MYVLGIIIAIILTIFANKHWKYMESQKKRIKMLEAIAQSADIDKANIIQLKSQLELEQAEKEKHKEMYSKCADDSEGLIAIWEEKLLDTTNKYSNEKKKYAACETANSKCANDYKTCFEKRDSLEKKLVETTAKNSALDSEKALMNDSLSALQTQHVDLKKLHNQYKLDYSNDNDKFNDLENKLQSSVVQIAQYKDKLGVTNELLYATRGKLEACQARPFVNMKDVGPARVPVQKPYKAFRDKTQQETFAICKNDPKCQAVSFRKDAKGMLTRMHPGKTIREAKGWHSYVKAIDYSKVPK